MDTFFIFFNVLVSKKKKQFLASPEKFDFCTNPLFTISDSCIKHV